MELHSVLSGDAALGHPSYHPSDLVWKYLSTPGLVGETPVEPSAPLLDLGRFRGRQRALCSTPHITMWVIRHKDSCSIVGMLGLMNTRPADLVTEIGMVAISPAYQATPVATEATFLLLRYAFGMRYRRLEWKCDVLNVRSQLAARRIGFVFEGVFRGHMLLCDLAGNTRNRDTWWGAMIRGDWERASPALEAWITSPAAAELYARRRRQLAAMKEG